MSPPRQNIQMEPSSSSTAKYFAIGIIASAAIIAYASAWNDSIIVDEDPHIGAGYSYLVKQDMRLNPEHPPLVKDFAALPLLFLGLDHDAFETKSWQEDINGQWDFGRALIFKNNAILITHVAKIPPLILFVIAAWFVCVFAYSHGAQPLCHDRYPRGTGCLVGDVLFFEIFKNFLERKFLVGGGHVWPRACHEIFYDLARAVFCIAGTDLGMEKYLAYSACHDCRFCNHSMATLLFSHI